MANMESTLALFTEARLGYGIKQAGQLFAFVGVMMAFTQGYLVRKLLPKWKERKLLIIGSALAAVGLGFIGMTWSTYSLAFVLAAMAIGSGLSSPAILGGISVLTANTEQGAILGVTQGLSSLARVLGPSCGGFLFTYVGISSPFLMAGLVSLVVLALAWINRSKLPEGGARGGLSH
jgi:MFS family permease